MNKTWYAIKRKAEKRWYAYEVSASHLKHLKDDYEYRGPYSSLVKAMIGVNKETK